MSNLHLAIIQIVKERQRGLPPNRGVLPVTVQCFLDDYRAEQTLRRDMAALWQAGKLERVGGTNSRRGYRIRSEKIMSESEVLFVDIKRIRQDGGTQFRLGIDKKTVMEYVEALQDGIEFPPIEVFDDGEYLWLAHGYHRLAAHKECGYERIKALVRYGSKRDAVVAALSANATNGLPRSNDDKRKAVVFALRDPELRKLSQREIAKVCGVTQAMVSKVASEIMPSKKKNDNGYQFDDPLAVIRAMSDEQKAKLIEYVTFNNWLDPAFSKRFQQLGLMTVYNSGQREMTQLAQETLKVLLSGDRWLSFEIDLIQRNRQADQKERIYISSAGHAREVLQHLLVKNGWDDLVGAKHAWSSWANLLAWGGYVRREVVKVTDYQGTVYFHITREGCKALDLPYSVPMKPPPTVEEYLQQKAQRDEEWRAQQRKLEEERAARQKVDPAKAAEQEREMAVRYLGFARDYVTRAEYLKVDKDKAAAMIDKLVEIVEAAGVAEAEAG
jgi:hypothetical protein